MQIEFCDLAALTPYARNARTHSAEQVAQIAASLVEFGWTNPVLVDADGGIIAGHGRVLAAAQVWAAGGAIRGLERGQIPTIALGHLTEAQRRAYVLADNRIALNAGWDDSLLRLELTDLQALGGVDLGLLGFGAGELAKLLAPTGNTEPDDAPPLPEAPVSRLGDTWACGAHRVRCGDATSAEDVAALLDGVKPDMVFTDPPYGIEVVRQGRIGGDKPFGRIGGDHVVKAGVYAPIVGDNSITTALKAYAICAALKIKPIIMWGGNFYAHELPPAKCWIVWDKETDGNFGDGEIAWCNADKSVRIFRHKWSGMLKASERHRRMHPTQKPIALAAWAFAEFGAADDTVLDLFLGSGTTMIAAEMEGRAALGMEIAPAYVDVSVLRWMKFSGKTAILESNGKPFEEVREMRMHKAA